MDDLISRELALKESHQIVIDGEAFDVVQVESLLGLPSVQPKLKWIPVTKGLPLNDTNVIVTVRDDSGDTPWEYTSVGWQTPDGQYWVVDNEISYGVIAWMPLPESYKGD